MARSHAAVTNNRWPGQRHPADADPRNGRAAPQGQQPAQPGGYPQNGYPDPQGAAPAYDPQLGYHYPQQGAPGQRQALSSLERPASDYAQPGYGQQGQPSYGEGQQPAQPYGYGQQPGAPYPGARQPAPGYDQWAAPAQDPRGYDLGNYLPSGGQPGGHVDPLQQADWAIPGHAGYGDVGAAEAYQNGQMGYDQGHSGALEQAYSHEDGGEYEAEEPRRSSWLLRIAGAIVVAVGLGYGLAQGYKLMTASAPQGATPVVRGEGAPTRTLPEDPGGRQFSHTDSKVMGRLADGSASDSDTGSLTGSDTDASGTRRVRPLVVRRDGTIVPPDAPAEPAAPEASVAVPGVTVVDGFGGRYPGAVTTTATPTPAAETPQPPTAARKPVVVKPPESSAPPQVIAKATPAETPPAAEEPAPKSAEPSAPPAASSGANGYVVVLASVPASDQSRLAALKKFADMQQQFGTVLQDKTPDVKEANLGAKGVYHRLLVGPPSSRAQASALCRDLKAAGYKDCWVTAY